MKGVLVSAKKMQTEFELFRINKSLSHGLGLFEQLHQLSLRVMKCSTNHILLSDVSSRLNSILNPVNLKLSLIDPEGIVVGHFQSGVKVEDHEFMADIRHGLLDYSQSLSVIDHFAPTAQRLRYEHIFGQKLNSDRTYIFLNHEYHRELFATILLCFDRSITSEELNFISRAQELIKQRITMNMDQSTLLNRIENQSHRLELLEEKLSQVRVVRQGLRFYEV
tara:strand:+ start:7520 stop:8185 length:666 start_codon:yes stop_codon:yes gene_type:complete